MSPMDRGRRDIGEVGPDRAGGRHRAAHFETRCAYFNTFQALGGAGTMGRWRQASRGW
jgi:hypothetical protein